MAARLRRPLIARSQVVVPPLKRWSLVARQTQRLVRRALVVALRRRLSLRHLKPPQGNGSVSFALLFEEGAVFRVFFVLESAMFQFVLSSWRSGFRSKVFLAIFFLGLALVGLAYLSASFSPRQPLTVSLDVGLSGIRFSLVLFAITLIQDNVGREIERRTVVLTLSYPVARAVYIAGRYLGVLALTGAAAVILGLLLQIAVIASGFQFDQQFRVNLGFPYWAALFGVWIDVAVVSAFTIWIAALSTVSMLPLVLGALFAIAGRAVGAVFDFISRGADGQTELVSTYGPVLDLIRWVLPDLSRLDWRAWPMYDLAPDTQSVVLGLAMALFYAAAMLCLAVNSFVRREFS